MITFHASCSREHDRVEFVGAVGARDWTAHMLDVHGTKPIKPGTDVDFGAAPGWRNGRMEPMDPHKVPAHHKDWHDRLVKVAAANPNWITPIHDVEEDEHEAL